MPDAGNLPSEHIVWEPALVQCAALADAVGVVEYLLDPVVLFYKSALVDLGGMRGQGELHGLVHKALV